ncbi:hypothetical protein BT67DRAFT_41186 [Trichocladium antarcticum]|uniref:Uncharacterized protein n=1 Tax=Trichocladium antarcticum TaxID=1450529 RepID=A0AAN6UIM1_9PEZI|nr:hypothetical protein BT67DRAFT_41186 [Trichocladium antarcticum]
MVEGAEREGGEDGRGGARMVCNTQKSEVVPGRWRCALHVSLALMRVGLGGGGAWGDPSEQPCNHGWPSYGKLSFFNPELASGVSGFALQLDGDNVCRVQTPKRAAGRPPRVYQVLSETPRSATCNLQLQPGRTRAGPVGRSAAGCGPWVEHSGQAPRAATYVNRNSNPCPSAFSLLSAMFIQHEVTDCSAVSDSATAAVSSPILYRLPVFYRAIRSC